MSLCAWHCRVWRRCRLLIWSVNIQKYLSRAEKFPLLCRTFHEWRAAAGLFSCDVGKNCAECRRSSHFGDRLQNYLTTRISALSFIYLQDKSIYCGIRRSRSSILRLSAQITSFSGDDFLISLSEFWVNVFIVRELTAKTNVISSQNYLSSFFSLLSTVPHISRECRSAKRASDERRRLRVQHLFWSFCCAGKIKSECWTAWESSETMMMSFCTLLAPATLSSSPSRESNHVARFVLPSTCVHFMSVVKSQTSSHQTCAMMAAHWAWKAGLIN